MTPGPITPEAAAAVPPVAPRSDNTARYEIRRRFARFVRQATKGLNSHDALSLIAHQERDTYRAKRLSEQPGMTQDALNTHVEAMQQALDNRVSKMLRSKDPRERAAAHDYMKYRIEQDLQKMKGAVDELQKLYDEASQPEAKTHYAQRLQEAKKRVKLMEGEEKDYLDIDGQMKEMTLKEQADRFSSTTERNNIKGADGNPIPDQFLTLVKKFPNYDNTNPLTFLGESIHALVQNRNKGSHIAQAFSSANLTFEERTTLNTAIEMAKQGKTEGRKLAERTAKGGLMALIMMFLFAYLSSKMDKGGGGQMAMGHG